MRPKLRRGMAAARRVVLSKPAKGRYLAWIGDSLTPLIGSASGSSGLSVTGGFVGGLGLISLTGIAPLDSGVDSVIFAFRYWNNTIFSTADLVFGDGISSMISAGAYPGSEGVFAVSSDGFQFAQPASPGILPAASTAEHTIVLAYDAGTDKVVVAVDGVLAAWGDATALTGSLAITELRSSSVNLRFRDVHLIRFAAAGLPGNLSGLVAAYHANPLTKLSAWAN